MDSYKYTLEQQESVRQRLMQMSEEFSDKKQNIDVEVDNFRKNVNELPKIVSDSDAEFEKKTSITGKDYAFLAFASTLQVSRQLITARIKTRLTDKESAEQTPFHTEEHSDRKSR